MVMVAILNFKSLFVTVAIVSMVTGTQRFPLSGDLVRKLRPSSGALRAASS